jgi:hypothetical protein
VLQCFANKSELLVAANNIAGEFSIKTKQEKDVFFKGDIFYTLNFLLHHEILSLND